MLSAPLPGPGKLPRRAGARLGRSYQGQVRDGIGGQVRSLVEVGWVAHPSLPAHSEDLQENKNVPQPPHPCVSDPRPKRAGGRRAPAGAEHPGDRERALASPSHPPPPRGRLPGARSPPLPQAAAAARGKGRAGADSLLPPRSRRTRFQHRAAGGQAAGPAPLPSRHRCRSRPGERAPRWPGRSGAEPTAKDFKKKEF